MSTILGILVFLTIVAIVMCAIVLYLEIGYRRDRRAKSEGETWYAQEIAFMRADRYVPNTIRTSAMVDTRNLRGN